MRKRLIYFVQVFVGIVLVLLGPNAQAVRMGTLSVESALGEPLKASIRLYELGEVVIGRTAVSMASPSTYDSLGLIYNDLISRINLQYEDEGNGSLIRLSTKDPVNEVVLDLQVEFVGPEGKVSKTYVAFIDPPFLIDERLSSFALESELLGIEESTEELLIEKDIDVLELVDGPEAIEVEAEPVIDDLVQRTESISSTPGSIDEMGSDATQASVYGRQIIVRTGDTLTKIAQREKLSDFSIEQMLVGVFRKNREAFVGDNMNRLRAGNVIRIPIEDELETISANEATSEIKIHMAEWRVYKDNLAARSSVQLQTTIEQADRTKSGVVETAPNQVNVKPQAENAYVVEVSKGTASGDLGSQGLEERLLATEKALAEQKTRADELEKIIADLTSLAQSKQDLGSAIQPEREQAVGVPITVVRENIERPWQAKIIEAVFASTLISIGSDLSSPHNGFMGL
ncbi:MAG: FimV family protein [Burkholderiales bacterium]